MVRAVCHRPAKPFNPAPAFACDRTGPLASVWTRPQRALCFVAMRLPLGCLSVFSCSSIAVAALGQPLQESGASTAGAPSGPPPTGSFAPPPASEPTAPAAQPPPPAPQPLAPAPTTPPAASAPAPAPPPNEPPPPSASPPPPAPAYDTNAIYEPPPPPRPPEDNSKRPEFSIRLDPFNWLLEGRLGLELEVQLYKQLTLEVTPVFVTSESPPTFNFVGREDNLTQESNGLGPISGTSVALGIWFERRPFKGTVLRGVLTNYAYTFKTTSGGQPLDQVNHTEREFLVFLASYSRWGAFTLGGGFGLGVALKREQRCFVADGTGTDLPGQAIQVKTDGCPDDAEQHILLDPVADPRLDPVVVANLNGFLFPVVLDARLSLGVSF